MKECTEHEIRVFTQKCFDENMEKYGFSFVPSGIYKVAFDNNNELYSNWQERMRSYKPSIVEHPLLYKSIRLFDKKVKARRIK